jgi:glutathione synthase
MHLESWICIALSLQVPQLVQKSIAMNDDDDDIAKASAYCVSHGILMGARDPVTRVPLGDNIFEHAPFSLYPTDFPKAALEKAYQMGEPFNNMVHSIASENNWLLNDAIPTAAIGDPQFTGRLVDLAKQVLNQGRRQKVVLGILRSDYMLHRTDIPLQVELNTIASSFGCLSSKVSKLHRELCDKDKGVLPDNQADEGIAKGLALALQEYKRQYPDSSNPVIVMVVQPGETNSCDQRDLEFLLNAKYHTTMVRRTLHELSQCSLSSRQELELGEKLTAGVVYYRAGYTPDDYPSETEWAGRSNVEHSTAIKCPDVFYHIAGAKKVQQALAMPGILDQFTRSVEESTLLQSCFAKLYALGEGDDKNIVDMALKDPQDYVLKPQREGGGNNLYNDELVHALQSMSHMERGGYILMQKILPPPVGGSLIRRGKVVYEGECVCELGVFGVTLRDYDDKDRILMNDVVGHILRTKPVKTDEGGVAAGYAFLSSPKLVTTDIASKK